MYLHFLFFIKLHKLRAIYFQKHSIFNFIYYAGTNLLQIHLQQNSCVPFFFH